MQLSPHLVALVLSPVATELPETINALIWVRQGKERLALANISGAMMIQATIPSALALFATPWLFDAPLMVAGAADRVSPSSTCGGCSARGVWMRAGCCRWAVLYGVFAVYVAGYFSSKL